MTKEGNLIYLNKYLRKLQRKVAKIDLVYRERGLNGLFDLLERAEEEGYKARSRINVIRFPHAH